MKNITLALLLVSTVAFPKNLALKNFMEIFASLQVSTNLKADKELNGKFLDVRELLPQHGSIDEYTTPMQLGVVKISGDFCHKRVTTDAALQDGQRWLHHGVDFTKAPTVLNEKERLKVIYEYTDAFWQRSPTKEEETSLMNSFDALAKVTPDSKQFFSLFCIGFGSSLNFLTI